MKRFAFLGFLGCFLLAGCGNNNQSGSAAATGAVPPKPPDSQNTRAGGLAGAQNLAVKTVDTAGLNQAIQLFNVEEGRFPKDLNELVEKKVIGQIPAPPRGMKLDYNATTGVLRVIPE